MSSGKKCKHCGSSEIEVDPARGDAVCTNCGSVLEDSIIVADLEFQETAHGGASVIGQFVSAESKGGASGFGRGLFIFNFLQILVVMDQNQNLLCFQHLTLVLVKNQERSH